MIENQINQIITENQKNLKNIKIFGGIGSILVFLFPFFGKIFLFFGKIGPILWLVGYVFGCIFLIIAIHKISKITGERKIFRNYIVAFVLYIIVNLLVFELITVGKHIIIAGKHIIIFMIGGILLAWFLMILSGYFIKKSFNGIFEVTGKDYFQIAGERYFWGAILIIILIGAFIQLTANVYTIAAFFSLPDKLEAK